MVNVQQDRALESNITLELHRSLHSEHFEPFMYQLEINNNKYVDLFMFDIFVVIEQTCGGS